jgi:hypothetical protein
MMPNKMRGLLKSKDRQEYSHDQDCFNEAAFSNIFAPHKVIFFLTINTMTETALHTTANPLYAWLLVPAR